MPYFPHDFDGVYRCNGCGGWFLPSGISCCVKHPAGTCCHEYEQQVVVGVDVGAGPDRTIVERRRSAGWN